MNDDYTPDDLWPELAMPERPPTIPDDMSIDNILGVLAQRLLDGNKVEDIDRCEALALFVQNMLPLARQ